MKLIVTDKEREMMIQALADHGRRGEPFSPHRAENREKIKI
jgi:hypothetical protein